MYLQELNIINGNGKDIACEMYLEISFSCGKNIRQRKDGNNTRPRTLQPEFPAF